MPVQPPDRTEMAGVVERLCAESAPTAPDRRDRPQDQDDACHAWYVTTDITGGGQGPLSGRTAATEDDTVRRAA